MSGTEVSEEQQAAPHIESDIPCVSQDPNEPCAPRYLGICTGTADLISVSRYCPPGECGGHPICRPCYDLARREGLVR